MQNIVIVAAIALGCLTLAARLMRKTTWMSVNLPFGAVKRVSVNFPLGVGSVELDTNPVERNMAWALYIELITRISVQPLEPDQGLVQEALTSLYSLFNTTREILKQGGPIANVSSKSVSGIAIKVLNEELRPLLSKWHPALEEWEAKRDPDTSRRQHEKAWPKEEDLRAELERVRQNLVELAEALAKIACA